MVQLHSIYTTFSHLHICLIPRTSPPPTVACKTTGGEHLGNRLYRISNVSRCLWGNITCVVLILGSLYTLCVITVKCCMQQGLKTFGGGLKSCKDEGSTS